MSRAARLVAPLVAALTLALPAASATAAGPQTETADAGAVHAELTWTASDDGPPYATGDQHLVISNAGAVIVDETIPSKDFLTPGGAVEDRSSLHAEDFDGDGTVEVVLEEYTGGAHCCLEAWVYSGASPRVEHDFRDAGFDYEDIDGDGTAEFVSSDARFAGAFTSYAGSEFPLQAFAWTGGTFLDVTRQDILANRVRKELTGFRRGYKKAAAKLRRRPRDIGAIEAVKGNLVAYAADHCTLGDCAKAFKLVDAAVRRREVRTSAGAPGPAGRTFARDLRRLLRLLGYR